MLIVCLFICPLSLFIMIWKLPTKLLPRTPEIYPWKNYIFATSKITILQNTICKIIISWGLSIQCGEQFICMSWWIWGSVIFFFVFCLAKVIWILVLFILFFNYIINWFVFVILFHYLFSKFRIFQLFIYTIYIIIYNINYHCCCFLKPTFFILLLHI